MAIVDRFDARKQLVTRFTVKVAKRSLLHHLNHLHKSKKLLFHWTSQIPSSQKEAKALRSMSDCPFLAGLVTARLTVELVFYVIDMPMVQSIRRFLGSQSLTERQTVFYLAEMVCAIEFLHGKNLVFVNLAIDNVFIDTSGHVKLLHFGLCNVDVHHDLSVQRLGMLFCSHTILKSKHDRPRDWWNLGVCSYWLLTGQSPFLDRNHVRYPPDSNVDLSHLSRLSSDATELIEGLLHVNADQRLGMPASAAGPIKQHHFFRGVDWQALSLKQVEPPLEPDPETFDNHVQFPCSYSESDVNEALSWVCENCA